MAPLEMHRIERILLDLQPVTGNDGNANVSNGVRANQWLPSEGEAVLAAARDRPTSPPSSWAGYAVI